MKFGEHLFSGSRFIFWSLTPFLLGFVVSMPLMIEKWNLSIIILVIAMEIPALCLALGLYDTIRFRWALRIATGMVFAIYSWYLVDMWVLSDKEFKLIVSRSEASPMTSLLGFVIIGIPSLIFTLKGRFTLEPMDDDLDQS